MFQSAEAFEWDSQLTRASLDSLMDLLRTQWNNGLISLTTGRSKTVSQLGFHSQYWNLLSNSLNISQYEWPLLNNAVSKRPGCGSHNRLSQVSNMFPAQETCSSEHWVVEGVSLQIHIHYYMLNCSQGDPQNLANNGYRLHYRKYGQWLLKTHMTLSLDKKAGCCFSTGRI